jgi:hypothetical protein
VREGALLIGAVQVFRARDDKARRRAWPLKLSSRRQRGRRHDVDDMDGRPAGPVAAPGDERVRRGGRRGVAGRTRRSGRGGALVIGALKLLGDRVEKSRARPMRHSAGRSEGVKRSLRRREDRQGAGHGRACVRPALGAPAATVLARREAALIARHSRRHSHHDSGGGLRRSGQGKGGSAQEGRARLQAEGHAAVPREEVQACRWLLGSANAWMARQNPVRGGALRSTPGQADGHHTTAARGGGRGAKPVQGAGRKACA